MDKVGYKDYLRSLGNQQYYIGLIPELIELEKSLNINLDDYVPYNSDFGKINALNALLPKDKLYSERLQFSINSYMRYKLSDYDKEEKSQSQEAVTCDEYFTFSGTENELKEKLSSFMSEEDSQTFIYGIQKYSQYFREDEFVEWKLSFPLHNLDTDTKILHYLIPSCDYNINLKALTITTLALLLDIKLTVGFASTTLAILGFNNQAIVKIDASEGEKCLILEAMRSRNRVITEDVLSSFNGQCIHDDLGCNYQECDRCIINKDKIKSILNKLDRENVFNKINGFYKYNF